MSFSYSAVRSNAKVTLPSVESWSIQGNTSILKEPKKSVTVPKRDKVGDLNDIRQTMDTYAKERLYQNEVISVFPKQVNPAGGTRMQNIEGGTQASLPIKIADNGAVRFSVTAPRDQLPLSRASRYHTKLIINNQKKNFDGRTVCVNAMNNRAINKNYTPSSVKPTASYSTVKSYDKGFEVKRVIQNPFHARAFSVNDFKHVVNKDYEKVNTGIDGNYSVKKASAANQSSYKSNFESDDIRMERNVRDAANVKMNTRKMLNTNHRGGAEENDHIEGRIKVVHNIELHGRKQQRRDDSARPTEVIRLSEGPNVVNAQLNRRENRGIEQNSDTNVIMKEAPKASATLQNVRKMNVQVDNTVENFERQLNVEEYRGDRTMCAGRMTGRAHMNVGLCDKKSKLLANLNN